MIMRFYVLIHSSCYTRRVRGHERRKLGWGTLGGKGLWGKTIFLMKENVGYIQVITELTYIQIAYIRSLTWFLNTIE